METNIKIGIDPSGAATGAAGVNAALNSVKMNASNAVFGVDSAAKRVVASVFSLKGALVATSAAVAAVVAISIKGSNAARTFEASISELSAITGAVGEDLKFLADASKEFGRTTTLSASEAAEAFKLVASAKPDLLENKEALKAVTKEAITLAQAAGIALPEAATTLGAALNQFQEDASESARFINVLAAGAKFGSSEIADTALALKDSGTVAAAAGIEFEELNAAIQVLSAVSIKGSQAGVGLRNIILKLQNQADAGLNPAIVGLGTALENLSKKQLSTTQLTKLFGLENVTAASALAQNAGMMGELTTKLTGTNTAYEQASVRVDNFQGSLKELNSVVETIFINIGEKLNPTLRRLTNELKGLINSFDEDTRAAKLFETQLAANKTLIEAYGFSLEHINPESLEDVNRIIQAMTLNGVNLEKQAPFSRINDQILDSVFALTRINEAYEKVAAATGEDSAATSKLVEQQERLRNKIRDLTNEYIALDNAQKEASKPKPKQQEEKKAIGPGLDALAEQERLIHSLSTETENASDALLRYNALWQGGIINIEQYERAVKEASRAYGPSNLEILAQEEQIIRSLMSPLELYEAELLQINALWQGGLVSVEEYERRVKQAADTFSTEVTPQLVQGAIVWSDAWSSAGNRFASSIGDAVAEALFEQQNFSDAMKAIARDAIKSVISGLVEIGIKKVALYALEKAGIVTTTAAVVSSNQAIAASAAPAAAGVSLATMGANAIPAISGILATIAAVAAISGARAGGGSVEAGKTYLVGERGPELFTAPSSGEITPNNKMGGVTNNYFVVPKFTINAVNASDGAAFILRNKNAIRKVFVDAMHEKGMTSFI
jgi:TP901 family phage tail tape measure protein